MDLALNLVVLVAIAAGGAALARRAGIVEPLFLIGVGVVGSLLPFVPDTTLDPEIVLIGLLPPLLYATAIRTSVIDLKAEAVGVTLLSVGLVAFTTVVVGFVTWWLLPIPLALGFAFGAVVAPPDAVAASAIANRVGMPRRIITVLEGESLLNDATALVALHTALEALHDDVTVLGVIGSFARAAGGGVLVGVVVAFALGKVRRHITDPVFDTTLSLLAPFAAYVLAERIHGSGVVAVVVTGLVFGQRAYVWQRASSRLAERINWRTIQFVLESVVFLLIGLEAREVIGDAWNSALDHPRLILAAVVVLAVVIATRPLWVYPTMGIAGRISAVRSGVPADWRGLTVVSWAGMRGVVTLAAVLTIPEDTALRPVLVLLALVVVIATIVGQGMTLPPLIRRLGLRGTTAAEEALQVAALTQRATTAGLATLDDADRDVDPDIAARLRDGAVRRPAAMWERLGRAESEQATPSMQYRQTRQAMIDAERAEVLRARTSGETDHEAASAVLAGLDLEESMIERIAEDENERRNEALAAPAGERCPDLVADDDLPEQLRPPADPVCSTCVAEGQRWVHLRMCLTCGEVGCCDSSVGKHATAHFRETQHPVMRSIEPGEAWRWCFVHQRLG